MPTSSNNTHDYAKHCEEDEISDVLNPIVLSEELSLTIENIR